MSAPQVSVWPRSRHSLSARAATPDTTALRVADGHVIAARELPTSTVGLRSGLRAAAFFDLDRTLIRRATPLALANTFRKQRVIRRRDLLRAAVWQLIFLIRGVEEDAVRRAAEDGMVLLRGVPVAKLKNVVGSAMEEVLRPLVYTEPLALLAEHHERGEAAYVISASLQEIVEQIASEFGFDGAIGSTCEIVDGIYTGRALRPCYGELKAQSPTRTRPPGADRSCVVDGVLRLAHRSRVPRGGRPSGRSQPRSSIARDRRGAGLAHPHIRRRPHSPPRSTSPARGAPQRVTDRAERGEARHAFAVSLVSRGHVRRLRRSG